MRHGDVGTRRLGDPISASPFRPFSGSFMTSAVTILLPLIIAAGCKTVIERQDVRPRVLRDVPARNLAYRLTPDVSVPSDLENNELTDRDVNIANFFAGQRENDASAIDAYFAPLEHELLS